MLALGIDHHPLLSCFPAIIRSTSDSNFSNYFDSLGTLNHTFLMFVRPAHRLPLLFKKCVNPYKFKQCTYGCHLHLESPYHLSFTPALILYHLFNPHIRGKNNNNNNRRPGTSFSTLYFFPGFMNLHLAHPLSEEVMVHSPQGLFPSCLPQHSAA